MFMSHIGRQRLQEREKKVMAYYDDMGPGKGNCTVGYGSLIRRSPCTPEELKSLVTEEQVQQFFSADLADAENAVRRNITVKVTQAQFDALVSYTVNRGPTGARPIYKLVNSGNFHAAGMEMRKSTMVKVRKNGKLILMRARGLIDRRNEESAPFLSTTSQPTGKTTK